MLNILEFETGRPDSPILLILHGLFGSADNWNSQARDLSDRFHVIVPDMPDHGASPHSDDISYPATAKAIRSIILGYSPDAPVNLLGHSMGGKAAMATALLYPELVRSLIVADIAPVTYPPRHHDIFRAMEAVIEAVKQGEVESRAAADRVMAAFVPDRQIRAFILKNLVPTGSDGTTEGKYRWRLNLDGLRESYETISGWPYPPGEESVVPFAGSALFLRAERSPYVPDSALPLISTLFPKARVEMMKGVGHWLHAEDRNTFLSLIRSFLP